MATWETTLGHGGWNLGLIHAKQGCPTEPHSALWYKTDSGLLCFTWKRIREVKLSLLDTTEKTGCFPEDLESQSREKFSSL